MAPACAPFPRAPLQASCSTALRDLQSPQVAAPHPPVAPRARRPERLASSPACPESVAGLRRKRSPRALVGAPVRATLVRLLEQFSAAWFSIVLYLRHLEKRDVRTVRIVGIPGNGSAINPSDFLENDAQHPRMEDSVACHPA